MHTTAGWLSPVVDPLNVDFISYSAGRGYFELSLSLGWGQTGLAVVCCSRVCTVPWAICSHNAVVPFSIVEWLYSHLRGLFGEVAGTVYGGLSSVMGDLG